MTERQRNDGRRGGGGKPNEKKGKRDVVDVSLATGKFFVSFAHFIFFLLTVFSYKALLRGGAGEREGAQRREGKDKGTTKATQHPAPDPASNCSQGGQGVL